MSDRDLELQSRFAYLEGTDHADSKSSKNDERVFDGT